jgi:stage II sporulation protein P
LVGNRLKEDLDRIGIGAEFSNKQYTNVYYPRLYQASRQTVLTAVKENKSLKYFIDIHRDSRRRDQTTINIHGKPYARISFIIGGANPHWKENEQFAKKLHHRLEELYPGLSKGVFLKSHAEGNGEYNQSLSPRSILIEIGGVDNTLREEYRSAHAFAESFADVYFQAKPVNG